MSEARDTNVPALPAPDKDLEWKRSLIFHRNYDNGKRKLIESASTKIWKGDYETPMVLDAYDSIGEGVFGHRGVVTEGESNGWKYVTKARRNGLPLVVVSEKVGKGFADVLYDGFVNSVIKRVQEGSEEVDSPRFESAIEHISQEQHIEYDNQERPIRNTTYQEVKLKSGKLFPESRLFAPVEESDYHYDEQGRMLARVGYEFEEDGEKKLSDATLYEYQQLEVNRVRVITRDYSRLRRKDIQDGAIIFLLSVKDFDRRDGKTLGYAVYGSETKRGDEILTHYERVKRNPLVQTFVRGEPPDGSRGWIDYQTMPESIPSPSYLIGKDVDLYLKDRDINKIGTPGDKERKMRVLFPEEFVDLVSKSTDGECFKQVSELLSGDLVVELGMDFVKTLQKYQDAIIDGSLISPMQRVALVSTFLPMFAGQINQGLAPKSEIDEILAFFLQGLAIDAKYRTDLRIPSPNPQIKNFQLTSEVINNLESFSDIVSSQPEAFTSF